MEKGLELPRRHRESLKSDSELQTAISLRSCEAARGFRLRRRVPKQGSERLKSRTEIQFEGEELQNQRTRFGQ